MIVIETPRLILKTFEFGEEVNVLNFLQKNKEHLSSVLTEWDRGIDDLEKAHTYIKRMKMGSLLKIIYPLGVWLKTEDKLIGEIIFFNVDWKAKKMEVGSFIDSSYQGRGLITEAKSKSLTYFFKEFELSEVSAQCNFDNIASKRVLEKCGFSMVQCSDENLLKFTLRR